MKEKYSKMIFDTLSQMEVNDNFDKAQFIQKNRDDYNHYADRSFTVLFCRIKKLIPGKKFKTVHGNIVRTA